MPNPKTFCNVPWTNTHIYWDGSYGMCCSERGRPSADPEHNVKHMSVVQWYNSDVMQSVRKRMLAGESIHECRDCYQEEQLGYESRRIKENFKSVIFTEQAFERSFDQSPMRDSFVASTDRLPIDWHVDLGNECNLACKMCNPSASSRVSAIFQRWNLIDQSANNNWTQNETAWSQYKSDLLAIPKLNRLHFMGGEPVLNRRFKDLLDFLLANGRDDLSVSFVTNGTLVDPELIDRLLKFSTCDIEVSLESVGSSNHYIRQGVDTGVVLNNLDYLLKQQTGRFHVILRSVPQLLSVNTYDQYILWAWRNKIAVQGVPLKNPRYMQISVLPKEIKTALIAQYQAAIEIIDRDNDVRFVSITTGRNANALGPQLIRECQSIIALLSGPDAPEEYRTELCRWLMRWDKEFELNALDFYPEYAEFLIKYGYQLQQ